MAFGLKTPLTNRRYLTKIQNVASPVTQHTRAVQQIKDLVKDNDSSDIPGNLILFWLILEILKQAQAKVRYFFFDFLLLMVDFAQILPFYSKFDVPPRFLRKRSFSFNSRSGVNVFKYHPRKTNRKKRQVSRWTNGNLKKAILAFSRVHFAWRARSRRPIERFQFFAGKTDRDQFDSGAFSWDHALELLLARQFSKYSQDAEHRANWVLQSHRADFARWSWFR